MQDASTLRLQESDDGSRRSQLTVIRWLTPGARQRYARLDRNLLSIGRSDDADIQLDAAGISRTHAELKRQGPIYVLSDLGSTNGTHVNGDAITHMPLSCNDVVRVGTVLGVVLRVDADLDLEAPDVYEPLANLVVGPGLREQWLQIQRLGTSTLPVVVVGPTGAGKESIALALHAASRRSGAFHAVNCAALPAALAEAELFGHRKGAFTSAEQASLGHFRAAEGGTLFLDELAELPAQVQSKLLRVLQEHKVTPLGETRAVPLDVRVLAAVQAPLQDEVAAGRLRQDLAMRLNGATIELPPLSARRADIAILFAHFLELHAGGSAPAVEAGLLEDLLLYAFPGNVRELDLLARRLLALHGHEPTLRRRFLPELMRRKRGAVRSVPAPSRERRDDELQRLCVGLRGSGGNLAKAAQAIGISRQRAYRLLAGRSVATVLESLAAGDLVEDDVEYGA